MSDSKAPSFPDDLKSHDDLQLWEARVRAQRAAQRGSYKLTLQQRWDNLKLGAVLVGSLAVVGMFGVSFLAVAGLYTSWPQGLLTPALILTNIISATLTGIAGALLGKQSRN